LPPLADIDYGDGKERPTTEQRRAVVEEFFARTCPATIDGQVVPPTLEWLKFEEIEQGNHLGDVLDFTFAKLRFVHPVVGEPKSVKLRWGIWFEEGTMVEEVDGEVVSHDINVLDTLIFTPHEGSPYPMYLTADEPEYTWHAPMEAIADAAPAPVLAATPRMLTIHLAPILIGLLGLVAIVGAAVMKLPGVVHGGLVLAMVAGGAFAWRALPFEIPHPAGGTSVPELTMNEAKDEFLRLHRGIYRAFEAEEENAIYNRLASSVDGPLLDRLYQEIYQSLIMRSEGNGAVSRVSAINYLETECKPAAEGPGYEIACSWRVNGVVSHWGHAHRRTNEYQADYLLAPRGDRWIIAGATVNLQKRVKTEDDDQEGEPSGDDPDPEA
jgi:hypothetical protein